jgi:hypothetical protein
LRGLRLLRAVAWLIKLFVHSAKLNFKFVYCTEFMVQNAHPFNIGNGILD